MENKKAISSRQNGKLGGRPVGAKAGHTLTAEAAKAYIIKRVSEELEPIITKQIQQAIDGDGNARKDLLDRAYGKPKETVEIQGVDFLFDEDD